MKQHTHTQGDDPKCHATGASRFTHRGLNAIGALCDRVLCSRDGVGVLHGWCLWAGWVVDLAGLGVVVRCNGRIMTVISVSGTRIACMGVRQSQARTAGSASDTPALPLCISLSGSSIYMRPHWHPSLLFYYIMKTE